MIVFDTSILIDIERGRDITIPDEWLVGESLPAISFISYAEFMYGVLKRDLNSYVKNDLAVYKVIVGDANVCSRYSMLRVELESTGRVIPDADIFIAASAIENNATLLTKDKHFEKIPGLKVKIVD